jgi:hypothetical protein
MTKITRSESYPGPFRPGYALDRISDPLVRGGKATWPGHSLLTRLTDRAPKVTDGRSFGRGGFAAMRCMACGAEMRLVRVVRDDTMMVTGYEHHTLQCSECHEEERRLVFSREGTPSPVEPAPAATPAPESNTSRTNAAETTANATNASETNVAATNATDANATDTNATETTPAASKPAPAAVPLPCANMLALVAELSATAQEAAEPAAPPTTAAAPAAEGASSIIEPSAEAPPSPAPDEPAPVTGAATNDAPAPDPGEILLQRAIALVRSPQRRSLASGGIADDGPVAPAEATVPSRSKRPGRVVQIQRAPDEAAYVALDTRSGLSVLRHADSTRLRAMCDRIGWQVVEG